MTCPKEWWDTLENRSVTDSIEGRLERAVGVSVLLGGALLVSGVSVTHVASDSEPLFGKALSLAAIFGLALPLFGGAIWVWQRDFERGRIWRVTMWSLAGAVPITALAFLIVAYQRIEGIALAETWTVVTWVAGGGMVGGFLTGIHDLRREDAKRDSDRARRRLQSIIDFVPVPLVTQDEYGTVTHWNPAAEEVFGWESDEILGEQYPLVPEEYQEEYRKHVLKAQSGEMVSGIETRRERKDGEVLDVQIFSAPRRTEGELEEVILALPDVSDLKERERALNILQEVSRELAGAHDTDEIFSRVTEAITRLFDDPVGGCWRYDSDIDELVAVDQTDAARDLIGTQPSFHRGDGLVWKAFESGDVTVFEDVREEDQVYNPATSIRSEIVLPLGEYGVLIVASPEVDAFDDVDIEIADSLAATAETALGRVDREEDLRMFRRAAEAAGHAVVITNAENEIEYVNRAFENITGYSAQEARGKSPDILNSGKMPDEHFELMWETLEAGEVWEEQIINRRKNGDLFPAEQTIAPIQDSDGSLQGYVGLQRDISDRIRLEEERKTFADIVQRLDDPIMQQDLDGNFEVVNDAVTDYADTSRESLIGRDEFAFMNDRTAARIAQEKERVLDTEEARTYEVDPVFPEMGKRSFQTTRYPHYDTDGNLDGTVAICRDVTDLKERERHLQVFDRVLRHNLNNDMNVIIGNAERILDASRGEPADAAKSIVDTGSSLVDLAEKERRIVDLLVDEKEIRSIKLEPLLERVCDGVSEQYPDCDIPISDAKDTTVLAIPEIEDAIVELVENAIKHTEGNLPSISMAITETESTVNIRVKDTGPGIPEMERKVLLGDNEITPLFHGSGLGLWLVNHIVSLSGGSLTFEENEPSGSIVELSLSKP